MTTSGVRKFMFSIKNICIRSVTKPSAPPFSSKSSDEISSIQKSLKLFECKFRDKTSVWASARVVKKFKSPLERNDWLKANDLSIKTFMKSIIGSICAASLVCVHCRSSIAVCEALLTLSRLIFNCLITALPPTQNIGKQNQRLKFIAITAPEAAARPSSFAARQIECSSLRRTDVDWYRLTN